MLKIWTYFVIKLWGLVSHTCYPSTPPSDKYFLAIEDISVKWQAHRCDVIIEDQIGAETQQSYVIFFGFGAVTRVHDHFIYCADLFYAIQSTHAPLSGGDQHLSSISMQQVKKDYKGNCGLCQTSNMIAVSEHPHSRWSKAHIGLLLCTLVEQIVPISRIE